MVLKMYLQKFGDFRFEPCSFSVAWFSCQDCLEALKKLDPDVEAAEHLTEASGWGWRGFCLDFFCLVVCHQGMGWIAHFLYSFVCFFLGFSGGDFRQG